MKHKKLKLNIFSNCHILNNSLSKKSFFHKKWLNHLKTSAQSMQFRLLFVKQMLFVCQSALTMIPGVF